MFKLKMKGDFHEDVKTVNEAISYLNGMLETLEKECIEHDKGKIASDMFIFISDMKRVSNKMVEDSKQLLRSADIDQYGPLSKYVRPYLGYGNN